MMNGICGGRKVGPVHLGGEQNGKAKKLPQEKKRYPAMKSGTGGKKGRRWRRKGFEGRKKKTSGREKPFGGAFKGPNEKKIPEKKERRFP